MATSGPGISIPASADERIRKWFERLADGVAVRRNEIEDWEKNEDLAYKRKKAHEDKDSGDQIAINKLGAWVEQRMAALAYRQPRVKMRPLKANAYQPVQFPLFDKNGGPVMEQALDPMTGAPIKQQAMGSAPRYKVLEATQNQIISHPNFDFAGELRRFIRASLLAIGAARVGYTADFEYDEDEEVQPIPADNLPYMTPEETSKYLMDEETGTPVITSSGMLVPKSSKPIEEKWFFKWVPYRKLIFDPDGSNRFQDHRWVAEECDVPVEDVKKDPNYKNTKNLRPTGTYRRNDREVDWYSDDNTGDPRERQGRDDNGAVRLFKIWDLEEKQLIVLADGHPDVLQERDFPDGTDPSTGPWVFYRPIERIDEWYPDPMASWLRTIAENYDKFNEQALRDGRKSARKILARTEDIGDDFTLDQLTDPYDQVVQIKNSNRPLGEIVSALEIRGVNPGTLALKNDLNRDFTEVGGSPDNAVSSADTATQANAIVAYDSMRENYQRGVLRLVLIDAMRKLRDSILANATLEQYVAMNGDDCRVLAGPVTYDMLQCDCEVDIDIEDLKPVNDAQRQMNLEKALVVVSQAPWLVLDPEGADAFFEAYGLKDERLIKGVVAGAQLQMQMMAAQAQPEKPTSGPAESDADAASKRGRAM